MIGSNWNVSLWDCLKLDVDVTVAIRLFLTPKDIEAVGKCPYIIITLRTCVNGKVISYVVVVHTWSWSSTVYNKFSLAKIFTKGSYYVLGPKICRNLILPIARVTFQDVVGGARKLLCAYMCTEKGYGLFCLYWINLNRVLIQLVVNCFTLCGLVLLVLIQLIHFHRY